MLSAKKAIRFVWNLLNYIAMSLGSELSDLSQMSKKKVGPNVHTDQSQVLTFQLNVLSMMLEFF